MTFDLTVVGGGIMGTPAAALAQAAGARTALIAPPLPSDGVDGRHGAHHDETRLLHVFHGSSVGMELTRRSVRHIDAIQAAGDEPILRRTGVVLMSDPRFVEEMPAVSDLDAVPIDHLDAAGLAATWPELQVADDAIGLVERGDAGIVNPRRLLAAVRATGVEHGLEVVDAPAVSVERSGRWYITRLSNGREIRSRQVLIAAGAFTNGLLDRPLAMRLKTESALYGIVGSDAGQSYAHLPGVIYRLDDPKIDDYYTAPGTRHPDGTWRLKIGANTVLDRLVDMREAVDWYREGSTRGQLPQLRRALLGLMPSLDCREWESLRCVITYTTHGEPYIGRVDDGGLHVATGGNGHSAKWSLALGGLAADLVLREAWTDPLPEEFFRPVFEDEIGDWPRSLLMSER